MIHLKRFNESQSDLEYHKLMIQDIFMDVIDEHDIEKELETSVVPGLYYMIRAKTFSKHSLEVIISINFHENGEVVNVHGRFPADDKNLQLYKRFSLLKDDLKPIDKKLNSMGYIFNKSIRSDDAAISASVQGIERSEADASRKLYMTPEEIKSLKSLSYKNEYNGEWWFVIKYEFLI